MSHRPTAVLFDLFHTLVRVPSAQLLGEPSVAEILGVSAAQWQRCYYDDDILGRCVGHVLDPDEATRRIARMLDPSVSDDRIAAAVENRRRRFARGLVDVDPTILTAIDRLRATGIRTALVSDAGADDVEAWPLSPLRDRFDATVFSYMIGIRKPSRGIYEQALSALGARASDAVFVGDGGSDEHRGARAVGVRAVLVTRLMERPSAEKIAQRRVHADQEFDDVASFVNALLG